MNKQKLGVTNFAYGIGPYLRTTELLIAFNNELEKRGRDRLSFVVPCAYGEKQRRIMLQEFEEHDKNYPHEILLDLKLGKILKSIFYGHNTYEESLSKWIATAPEVSKKIKEHLGGTINVETLSGEKMTVDGRNIVVELNRSPRILYNVAPSYSTTFGHIAEILEEAQKVGKDTINVDPKLLQKGVKLAESIESVQKMSATAYPGTMSWKEGYAPRYGKEILVPPITSMRRKHEDDIGEGIYVTVTGIPGLERLYKEARKLGLKLYSNDTQAVGGSVEATPRIVPNKNIILQFARSGWGSVWLSMLSDTPLVVPAFSSSDDPEIYFNNQAVDQLGIGIIYKGQTLREILERSDEIKQNFANMRKKITERFGTLTGNEICAKIFVDDFLAGN